MSAFQVSDAHLNAMLHFLRHHGDGRGPGAAPPPDLRVYRPTPDGMERVELGGWHEEETWQRAAALLWDENQRSLTSRYGDAAEPYDVASYYDPPCTAVLKPAAILKACDCYDYQACESSDYYLTAAHALVNAIRHAAYRDVPGYEAGPWDLKDGRFENPHRTLRA